MPFCRLVSEMEAFKFVSITHEENLRESIFIDYMYFTWFFFLVADTPQHVRNPPSIEIDFSPDENDALNAKPSSDTEVHAEADKKPSSSHEDEELGSHEKHLYLYHEEMHERPKIATFLNSLAHYKNVIPDAEEGEPAVAQPSARMGTLMGVFLPCIQNIFGVILFLRLTWLVGTAGIVEGM